MRWLVLDYATDLGCCEMTHLDEGLVRVERCMWRQQHIASLLLPVKAGLSETY